MSSFDLSAVFLLKNQLMNGMIRRPVKRALKNDIFDYASNFAIFERWWEEDVSVLSLVVKLVSAANNKDSGMLVFETKICEKCGFFEENVRDTREFGRLRSASKINENSAVLTCSTDELTCLDQRKPFTRPFPESENYPKNGFCTLKDDCTCGSENLKTFYSFSDFSPDLNYFCVKTKHGIDNISNIPVFEGFSWRFILVKHHNCKSIKNDDCYLPVVRCVDPDVTKKGEFPFVKDFRSCADLTQKTRGQRPKPWKNLNKIKAGLVSRVIAPENVRLIVYERDFAELEIRTVKRRKTIYVSKKSTKKAKLNSTL
jgi:hypothetical protein